MSAPGRFYGPWIVAACFFTFGIASGFPYYNIAFFFDYFRDDHGWAQQVVTFGPPIWLEAGEPKQDFLARAREAVLRLKDC